MFRFLILIGFSWNLAVGQTVPDTEIDPALLAGLKARSIGPAGMSGRVTAVEAVNEDPQTVFVGSASGGIWKSVDGGITFSPKFDGQPVHSIGALAIFQANPAIVWAGTGEGNTRNSASSGNGVYRSTDGGETWLHLGLDLTERIGRIALHPSDPDIAYVAALGRMWGENPERGLFRTTDGGKTWSQILYVDEKTGCADIIMDPVHPGRLFAAMWSYRRWPHFFKSGGPGSGLYVTHDGGDNWKRLAEEDGMPKGELGRIGLAIAPSDPEIVYAQVEAEQNMLIRSEDSGRTWVTVNTEATTGGRPFYFSNIRVDPQRPSRIYRLETLLYLSEDGGRHFDVVPTFGRVHVDFHTMWINPADGNHFFLGNDGGLVESRDRGGSFRFVANLPLAQLYHIAVDMEQPYHIYCGLQDNGSWRGPSQVWRRGGIRNHFWRFLATGDGFDTRPDPGTSHVGFCMAQGGVLMRWNLKTGATRFVLPNPPETGEKLRFNWNAGMAFDPHKSSTFYYGSQFVHKTTDAAGTWEIISPDLTTNRPEWRKQAESGGLTLDVTGAENYTSILAIAPSPVKPGVIWVGTDDGRIQLTRDQGKSWTSVEANLEGVPENGWIPHIEVSNFDAATAFLVIDHHRHSDFKPYVFRTRDYGKSWDNLVTRDLKGYALVIKQDPVNENLLFLGTEWGLYFTLDGGKRWMKWTHGFSTVSVMDLAIHPRDGDLIVGTHGRGIYIVDDIRPLRTLSKSTLAKPLHLFPIADAQQHWISFPDGGMAPGSGEFQGENRPYGALINFSLNPAEKIGSATKAKAETDPDKHPPDKVRISISDQDGNLLRTFETEAKSGLNRAVWDLRRDPFKVLPGTEWSFVYEEIAPEVMPGSYRVTVRFAGQETVETVRVLPDPSVDQTPADWQKRWDAANRLGMLNDLGVQAAERLIRLRQDMTVIDEKIRQATPEDKTKQTGQTEENPLHEAGRSLTKKLEVLEKRLWVRPGGKGIAPESDIMVAVNKVLYLLLTSWDPPQPSQLAYLDQTEAILRTFLVDFNRFFDEDVASYRQQVEAASIKLIPELKPLIIDP